MKNKARRGKTEVWGISIAEATPAIFTEEEGTEIDRILAGNKERASRNAKRVYELSRGFLYCSCGTRMRGHTDKHGKYVYEQYQCPRCGHHVDKVWLESNVREAILPILADKRQLELYLAQGDAVNTENVKSRVAFLRKQISRKLAVLGNLKKQHAWGDWSDIEYCQERDKIRAEIEELEREHADAEEAYRSCLETESDVRKLEHTAAQINEKFVNAEGEVIRQLYNALRLKVVIGEVISISTLVPLNDFAVVNSASR